MTPKKLKAKLSKLTSKQAALAQELVRLTDRALSIWGRQVDLDIEKFQHEVKRDQSSNERWADFKPFLQEAIKQAMNPATHADCGGDEVGGSPTDIPCWKCGGFGHEGEQCPKSNL